MEKDNKGLIVLVVILSLFVVGLGGYIIYDKIIDVEDETIVDNDENNGIDDSTVSSLELYKYKNYSKSNIVILDSSDDKINYDYIGKYDCYSNECKMTSSTSKHILVEDGGYYIYTYEDSKRIKLDIDGSYNNASLIEIDNVLYGISFDGKYYSLKSNKLLDGYDYVYGYHSINVVNDILFARDGCSDSTEVNASGLLLDCNHDYVINSNTGEIIKELEIDKNMWLSGIGTKENMYFAEVLSASSTTYGKIFDEKFNLILDTSLGNFDVHVNKNGNLAIVNDDNSYELYDNIGKKTYTSKKYKEIYNLLDEHVIVLDNDNFVKLISYDEKNIATYTELKDNYVYSQYASGYYDGGETKISGVYAVVEDTKETNYEKKCKEYYYEFSTGKVGMIEAACGGYAKPVLYLYPEEEMNVSITFEKPDLLTTTYPKYSNYWNVVAMPNGDLYDNNKYYYGLYWEENGSIDVSFDEGFYVTKNNAIAFLEDKLSVLGLNRREANEFIMYWLPILERNEKSLVYFELTDSRENYNKLLINPAPDSLLRIAIHIKRVDSELNIKEQKLPAFERNGFTAVEWGGVIH